MVGRLPLSGNLYLLRLEEVWPGGTPAVADEVTIAELQYAGDGILFTEGDPGMLGMMLRVARRLGVRGLMGLLCAQVPDGARQGGRTSTGRPTCWPGGDGGPRPHVVRPPRGSPL